ncbi:PTS sugar transporter subunit IIA [Streptococcus ovuberis]|uniref:PTS sugar transporter subunit IIA n=1 Tax=Streptococcus ovuberis TaxID=1936207 RepID=A0A7X6MX96_9STRE|nr:PTS sugar transporter subunit IIA [Streptococcus ovuberis]NKZ19418.1 PTS sugar transporter subunit IIA [Streptococcus ovuberis]
MADSIALLLMSHGNFAKAAIESAELIVGKQNNFQTLGIYTVDDVEVLKEEMLQKVSSLDTSKGLVVLTDIIGGTPINLASQLLSQEEVVVVSGLNLPMLLEVLMNRGQQIESLAAVLKTAYDQGFSVRTKQDLIEEGEEDDYSL